MDNQRPQRGRLFFSMSSDYINIRRIWTTYAPEGGICFVNTFTKSIIISIELARRLFSYQKNVVF